VSGRVRSARGAAAFIDRVGIALVFPSRDLVAPSLWEAVTGTPEVTVFRVEPSGRKVLTEELSHVWELKNELAAQGAACVGKHLRGRVAAISLELLPARYALTGRAGRPADFCEEELAPVERELAEALLGAGPQTAPALRGLVPAVGAKETKRALEALQRRLIVTQAGEEPQEQGWDAGVFDLVARRYGHRLEKLPATTEARVQLAAAVLRFAEVSAVDAAAVIGSTRKEAEEALTRLVELGRARRREEPGYTLWARAGSRASAVSS
jgi:hypothetical protein